MQGNLAEQDMFVQTRRGLRARGEIAISRIIRHRSRGALSLAASASGLTVIGTQWRCHATTQEQKILIKNNVLCSFIANIPPPGDAGLGERMRPGRVVAFYTLDSRQRQCVLIGGSAQNAARPALCKALLSCKLVASLS